MTSATNGIGNVSFAFVFGNNIRLEIPFFQRGYAWKKDNWDALFTDIEEQIISEIKNDDDFPNTEHFFGPIVAMEKRTGQLNIKSFLVIDGQQRLTTVYLLLGVIRNEIRAKKHLAGPEADKHIDLLTKHLENTVPIGSKDDYEKLKIHSGKGDRLPTYRVIFGNANPRSQKMSEDFQHYNSKSNQVDAFEKFAQRKLKHSYNDVPSLWRLAQALLQSLQIVWIPLDENKDEPQAIFESLNDKGMRLSASELLCSYLFRPLSQFDAEHLHSSVWLPAIKELDGLDEFQEFLRALLSIGQKKMVGKDRKTYIHFKKAKPRPTEADARQFLKTIEDSYPIYKAIKAPEQHPDPHQGIERLLIQIKDTNMESSAPFLLALLRARQVAAISEIDTHDLLRETLVLLVRRKICELPVTKYDVLFPQLLDRVSQGADKAAAFQKAIREDELWVSDDDFRSALVKRPIYRPRELQFTRMVLREIDKSLQSHGQLPDYSTLHTVEHVLPQTPDAAWKTYIGGDAQRDDLSTWTNVLGNLTILSQPANSSAGRNPFEAKIASPAYTDVCALTRDLKKRTGRQWNISAIEDRGNDLAQNGLQIWAWKKVA